MEGSSNALLIASNTNVSNFVSVKLSGRNNYLLWKAQMVCLLDSNNMLGIVDGSFVTPKDCSTVRQYDSLVKGWIFGSVSEDVLVLIYNLGSAKAVWEKLTSVYDPTLSMEEDSTLQMSDVKAQKEGIDVLPAQINTVEEGTNSIQIIVPTETQTKDENTRKSENKMEHKKKLREDTIKGDWLEIEPVLKKDKGLVTEAISSDGSTILHIAVGTCRNNIVKNLIPYINEDNVLKKRVSDGSTVLHIAAIVGNKDAADLLVKKNRKLLEIADSHGKQPLHKAYENMHLDTIGYLWKAMNDGAKTELQSSLPGSIHPNDEIGVHLLVNAISAKRYSLALELVQNFPKSASKSDDVLMGIAKTFPSGLDYGETLIYPSMDNISKMFGKAAWVTGYVLGICFLPIILCSNIGEFFGNVVAHVMFTMVLMIIITVPFLVVSAIGCTICLLILIVGFSFHLLYSLIWKSAKILAFAPIKHIENKKKEWEEAKEVLELVCDEIDKLDFNGTHHPYYTQPILEAACQNAYKVVDEILFRSPEVIQSKDKNGYDIIQLAIIHRSEKVYNLIYEIGERKNLYRTIVDSSNNNILHLAGKLAPSNVLNQRTGAALQLQRELQWREEVKKHVFPTYITQENKFKETPDMVFTREHEKLVKEGEKWMKTTAESCSITAALITTIVFAAAITVPGGSNQEKGTPLFKNEIAFIIFAISDAISLFASSTALLVFLSILTARFAEKDFLVSLPRRLFIGLFSLLLSTTAMMVAFSATLFLVFCEQKPWMLAPICGLAFIPIAFFITLQFPLMVDLFRSTYLRIFGKQKASVIRRFNPNDIRLFFGK